MISELDNYNLDDIDRHKPNTKKWDIAESILQDKLTEDPNFSDKIRRDRTCSDGTRGAILNHSFVYIAKKLLAMPLGIRLGKGSIAKVIKVHTRDGEEFALRQEEDLVKKYEELLNNSISDKHYSCYLKRLKNARVGRESEKNVMLKLGYFNGSMSRSSDSLKTERRRTKGEYYKYYSLQKLHKGRELYRIIIDWHEKTINLPDWQRFIIAIRCLEELRMFHKLGILHRDVKPENFVAEVSDNDSADDIRVKLVDFGFSIEISSPDLVLTEKSYMGSRYYVAPEIMEIYDDFKGNVSIIKKDPPRYSDKSDIFALGFMFAKGLKLSTEIIKNMSAREIEERPDIDTIITSLLLSLYDADRDKAFQVLSTFPATIIQQIKIQNLDKYSQIKEKLTEINEKNNKGEHTDDELKEKSVAILHSFNTAREKTRMEVIEQKIILPVSQLKCCLNNIPL